MKKTILLLILTTFCINLNAQQEEQEEYSAYLEQALEAVSNKDQHGFTTNMKYFSTAIERDKITPEILTEKNLKLYSECINAAVDVRLIDERTNLTPTDIAFLEYGTDNYPKNIRLIANSYTTGIFGFPQDYEQAYYWYDKAFEKKAVTMEPEIIAIPADYSGCESQGCQSATIDFLEKWANKGLASAMNRLANYYFEIGEDTGSEDKEERNRWWDKSMQWYQKAFEAGKPYEKAQAADGISNLISRTSTIGISENETHWIKEYLLWLEKYVEDFERNHAELIKDPLKNAYYKESLAVLAGTYQYTPEVKDKKKAKFYKDKACENGLKFVCGK